MSVRLLPIDGAAVMIRSGPDTAALLYATDPVITRLDDLEFITSEGPCRQAYKDRCPVLEPDLARATAAAKWPWFAPEAASIGAAAIFAFPLQFGRIVFGVLWLYRGTRGGLSGWDQGTAAKTAQTAAAFVLNDVAEQSREELDDHFVDSTFGRTVIDQALGSIAVQRHADIGQASALLRGAAYAQNRTSRAVAEDVLAHRLTFRPDQA